MEWDLRDAQDHFRELVDSALTKGRQVLRAGRGRTLVLESMDDAASLSTERPSFVDHLLSGPAWDDELVDIVSHREKVLGGDSQI